MIIVPKQDPIILDSSIAIIEAGINVWDNVTTYNAGDTVQRNNGINRIYKATQSSTGLDPYADVNATTGVGTSWADYGATNYTRAFDALSSSKCSDASQIYYKFQTADIDSIFLGALSAYTVRIVVTNTDASAVLVDETIDTAERDVYDWFDWTFAVVEHINSITKSLPMAQNSTLEIYINGTDVSVGHIVFGRSINVGLTLREPNPVASVRSLTSKSRDEWGNIITRKKARYKRMTISCLIGTIAIDAMQSRLEGVVDKPCVFVGDEREGGHKALLIYGELKDHDMPIDTVLTAYQLEVEGYI